MYHFTGEDGSSAPSCHPPELMLRSGPIRTRRVPGPWKWWWGCMCAQESQWSYEQQRSRGSWGGEYRGKALRRGSEAQGGVFFPLLTWLRGAWAQAEKQGCYVAMETEGSSLPHSRNHGDWGVGWEEDVSLAAPRVGARRPVTPPSPPSVPFFSPPHCRGQQPAGGIVWVLRVPV